MNIYYYLFYKLSRALNKKGKNEWGVIYALTIIVGYNIALIYINVLPVTKDNFNDGYKIGFIFIAVTLFITNSILFLNKKRVKRIKNRYKDESLKSKRTGNFFVLLYVIITLISIFFA